MGDDNCCVSRAKSETGQPISLRPRIHGAGWSSKMMSEARRRKALAKANRCHSPTLSSAPPNQYPVVSRSLLADADRSICAGCFCGLSNIDCWGFCGQVAQGNVTGSSRVKMNGFLEQNRDDRCRSLNETSRKSMPSIKIRPSAGS